MSKTFTVNTEIQTAFTHHLTRLTTTYSKLLPLRIDFHYATDFFMGSIDDVDGQDIDFIKAKTDITKLCQQVMNEINHVIGYIWVMELSDNNNLHFHTLFYVNGQRVQKYYPIYVEINRLWKQITSENAYTYDCNQNKKDYRYNCLNVFQYSDIDAINKLNYVMSYLAKKEQKTDINDELQYDISDVPVPSGFGRPRQS